MAFRTVRPFPADCDPFAPVSFVLYKQRKAEARRARRFRLAACTLFLVLVGVLAGFILTEPAHAFSADRLHGILNTPTAVAQVVTDAPLGGQSGWSLDVEAWRGNSASWTDPASTGGSSSILRYTVAWGGPERQERECSLSWAAHARTAAVGVVWAVSNRLLRGDDDIGGSMPGGATFSGMAVPWTVTALVYGMTPGETAGHIAADMFSEQIVGWSGELDMGYSSELPRNHPAYNPGDRYQDQIGMSAHLYRARALSMAMLKERHGDIDGVLVAHGMAGGAGYQLGRVLGEEGVTAGWETDRLTNKLFGSRPYVLGELAAGASFGLGVARTMEKAGCG